MNTIRPLQKFLAVNASSAAFTAPVDTLAGLPATAIDLSAGGSGATPCGVLLFPYGLGSDNDAFSVRLIGWSRVRPQIADNRFQWVPAIVADLAVVVSTDVGVAGGQVLNTERYADAITVTTEPNITADVTRLGTIRVTAPGANLRARALVPLCGYEALSLDFKQSVGTPTMNCLYRLVDGIDD